MRKNIIFLGGLSLLIVAVIWKLWVAPQWTQRMPTGWEWQANYIGVSAVPDPATKQLPTANMPMIYQRSIQIISDTGRPQSVQVADSYTIRDIGTGNLTWEYVLRTEIDPVTGQHLTPSYRGQYLVFPRHVEKTIYRLRMNYLEDVPVTYQHEELIEGLRVYLFEYRGRGEYTRSYIGTEQYAGVDIQPGQEIKCADDQFVFKAWVEPLTGEILKLHEQCLSGDYIFDIATGEKFAPVLRWSATTAGDDILIRADHIRTERLHLLWIDLYIPLFIASMGMILCIFGFLAHVIDFIMRKRNITAPTLHIKQRFVSLAVRILVFQTLGLAIISIISLTILYNTIKIQANESILRSGITTVELLTSVIEQETSLMRSSDSVEYTQIQRALDDFSRHINNFTRISIINRKLQVVADTNRTLRGAITDQNVLISIMLNPQTESRSLSYTYDGQSYIRIIRIVHGSFDPIHNTTVLGAVAIDLPTFDMEAHIRSAFIQAAGWLVGLLAVQSMIQYLFLRRSILTPLEQLRRTAQQIRQGHSGVRVPASTHDELGEVGNAFNEMVKEVEHINLLLRENSQNLQTIVETSPLVIVQLDIDLSVRLWNSAAERIFRWNKLETLGRPIPTIPPERQREFSNLFVSLQQGQALYNVTTQWIGEAGNRVDISFAATPLYDLAGNITGYNLLAADISQLKQAEDAMRIVNNELSISVANLEQRTRELTLLGEMSSLLQACVKPTEIYHITGQIFSKLFPSMQGILYEIPASRNQLESITSWNYLEIFTHRFRMDECWAIRRGFTHYVDQPNTNLICQHVSDEKGEQFQYLCVPLIAQGEALGLIHLRCISSATTISREIQQLAEAAAEQIAMTLSNVKLREVLRQQSIRDPLTGLFNRRYLDETLRREIERCRRDQVPLSVLMIDIDHFKQFNDTYGHGAGDVVLKSLGQLLSDSMRSGDIACRYGGEEFTCILPGASLEVANRRAEQLRIDVRRLTVDHAGQVFGPLSLSLGIATFPRHGVDSHTLLTAADTALYRAKQHGRDRVEVAG